MRSATLLALLLTAATALAQPAKGVLRVVSPEIPSRFAPTGLVTDSERAARDLVFESLVVVTTGPDAQRHVHPVLAERLPGDGGVDFTFRLRDRKWSTGDPVRATDILHTVRLLHKDAGADLAWHEGVERPVLGESPRDVRIKLAHGSVEPWPWFTFRIVPQEYKKREPEKLDDEEFLRSPVGSGPFVVEGLAAEGKTPYLRFRANPNYGGPTPAVREIRWFAATDPKEIAKLDPDIVLGHPPANLGTLKPLAVPIRRIEYVAINQRNPTLAQFEVRRFLGSALEIDPPANGLALADSWTSERPPRVPKSWHKKEIAATDARSLSKSLGKRTLSLKYAGPSALADAVVTQWEATAKAAGWELTIKPVRLVPSAFADSLRRHDYDLALTHEDAGDEIPRLAALFDPRAEALDPGGSNFLGARLTPESLRTELFTTRQFPRLVARAHNLHAHLYATMPLVPLRPTMTIPIGVECAGSRQSRGSNGPTPLPTARGRSSMWRHGANFLEPGRVKRMRKTSATCPSSGRGAVLQSAGQLAFPAGSA